MPRSRRDGRFLIVTLWFDPYGTAGAGLAGKRELPKGCPSAFREVPRRIPPTAPSGGHPPGARASRPHPVPWVAAQFPCDAATGHPPHRPVRSRAMPRLCQVFFAGGTPALPGGLHPITSSHPRRSIVLRVYSCSFVVRLQKQSAVSSSNDLPTRAGASLA